MEWGILEYCSLIVETLPEKLPKENLFNKILGFSLFFFFQYVDMCGDHVWQMDS